MKKMGYQRFLSNTKKGLLTAQIELTYRCRYRCVHCYCKNQSKQELDASFWKRVIDQMQDLGVLSITFTGGDPLLYRDFLEVYEYARKRGFLITIYTTGYEFNKKIFDFLEINPPAQIEITLNSLQEKNYENITYTREGLGKVLNNIREIKKRGLSLIIKCNVLKENREEVLSIKRFSEKLLGKGHFKLDPIIFAGLNHEKESLRHRLDPSEIKEIIEKDADAREYIRRCFPRIDRYSKPGILYNCVPSCFFINPQGIMRFCFLTNKYTTDLKKETLKTGYNRILNFFTERRRRDKRCFGCIYRKYCYNCPAMAFLEAGDEQAPVKYFCELAKAMRTYIRVPKGQRKITAYK